MVYPILSDILFDSNDLAKNKIVTSLEKRNMCIDDKGRMTAFWETDAELTIKIFYEYWNDKFKTRVFVYRLKKDNSWVSRAHMYFSATSGELMKLYSNALEGDPFSCYPDDNEICMLDDEVITMLNDLRDYSSCVKSSNCNINLFVGDQCPVSAYTFPNSAG